MKSALIISGRIREGKFVSDDPMPDVEARAELIVYPPNRISSDREAAGSIFDLFGKAKRLRSAEEIDAQVGEERSWGDE